MGKARFATSNGAQPKLDRNNSVRECRLCLEPGIERRCCGNYYCNLCYYKFKNCHSCHKVIDLSDGPPGIQAPTPWEKKWSKRVVIAIPAALILAGLLAYVYLTFRPGTLFGYQCLSYLDSEKVCVEYDTFMERREGVMDGRIETWPRCVVNDTNLPRPMDCVCGDVCTVTNCLFDGSDGAAGIDYKDSGFSATRLVMFEDWETGDPNPFQWDARSGNVDSPCGVAHGENSLRFRSPDQELPRQLISSGLSVPNGGLFEFSLRYATGGILGCEAVQSGTVSFQYSLVPPVANPPSNSVEDLTAFWREDNANWVDIVPEFPRRDYRVENFVVVEVEVPEGAFSDRTWFRWVQGNCFRFPGEACPATCTCDRDYIGDSDVWMIDNIKFFQHFEADWNTNADWQAFKADARQQVETSKCCYDCYECENPQAAFLEGDGCEQGEFSEREACREAFLETQCRERPALEEYTLPENRAIEHEYAIVIAGTVALIAIVLRCFQVFLRLAMSGVLICCRPCVLYSHRRRIRREHEEKVRRRAFEKAQQLAEEKERLEEEAKLQAAIDKELKKHTEVQLENEEVALPAHLIPAEGAAALNIVVQEVDPEEAGEASSDPPTSPGTTSDEGEGAPGVARRSHRVASKSSGESKASETKASDPGVTSADGKTNHQALRDSKRRKKKAEERAKRAEEAASKKEALLELDKEAIEMDNFYQKLATHNQGLVAAREADAAAERARVERVKAELVEGVALKSLFEKGVVDWNETRPEYDDNMNDLYNVGSEALAIHFHELVPPRPSHLEVEEARELEQQRKDELVARAAEKAKRREERARQRRIATKQPTPVGAGGSSSDDEDVEAETRSPTTTVASGHAAGFTPANALKTFASVASEDYSDEASLLSSGDEGGDSVYVTESDEEEFEEEDLNAILAQGHTSGRRDSDLGVPGLPQLFTFDERKRTDKYKPRRGRMWTLVYLIVGLAIPVLLALFLMAGEGSDLVSPDITFRLGLIAVKIKYFYITLCAVCVDLNTILRVALDVVGYTPVTRPSFRIIWAEPKEEEDVMDFMRKSAFVIDGGLAGKRIRVPLNSIRRTTFSTRYEPHLLAVAYVIMSQPWAVLAIVVPWRYVALLLACLAFFKVVYGVAGLHKLALVLYEVTSVVYVRSEEQRDRFAASCCGWRARLGASLMCAVAGPVALLAALAFVGFGSLSFNDSEEAVDLRNNMNVVAPIVLLLAVLAPYCLGWVLGCTHNLPVHPLMFLTNLGQGIKVHFAHQRQSELCESRRCFAGDPGKVQGTGEDAPRVDAVARACGFLPRNASHFLLDPFPKQEAVCYVFGINNAAMFKKSLTIEEIMARMEQGQKLLRSAQSAVAPHRIGQEAPPPRTMVRRRKASPKRRKKVRRKASQTGSVEQAVEAAPALPGSVERGEASPGKRRRRKVHKVKELPSVSVGNQSTEFAARRRMAKGGMGRLPPPRKPRAARTGSKKPNGPSLLHPDQDRESGSSVASDSSDGEMTPRTRALTTGVALPDPASKPPSRVPTPAVAAKPETARTATPAQPTRPQHMEDVTIPVLEGTFVAYDDTIDDPEPSPRFLRSLKYSKVVVSPDGEAFKSQRSPTLSPLKNHNQGRMHLKSPTETKAQREARLAAKAGGTINPKQARAYERRRASKEASQKALDTEVVTAQHASRKAQRQADTSRGLRRRVGESMGAAVLESPPPVRAEDAGEVTPFRMVGAAKDPSGVPASEWGLTSPPKGAARAGRRGAV